MRKILFLLSPLFISITCFAQDSAQQKSDSLLSVIAHSKEDTNLVHLLLDASQKNADLNPAQSIAFGKQALELSTKLKWKEGTMRSHQALAEEYWKTEDWAEAIGSIQEVIDLADIHTPKTQLFNFYNALGSAYTFLEIYPNARESFQKALEICKEINDEEHYNIVIGNLAWVDYNLGNYREALENGKKNLESSLRYNNKNDIANCYCVGGLIYEKLNRPDSAIDFFNKAVEMSEYIDPAFLSAALNGLGEVYSGKKQYAQALGYFMRARKAAEDNRNYLNLRDIYLNLSNTYEMLHQTPEALAAYKKYDAYKDTSNITAKQRQVALLQLQNKTRKKDVIQEASLQQQTLLRNVSIAGFLVVAVFALVLIVRYREKKKAHAKLEMTLQQLKATQQQLIQQEKLASLGQLTAGVAHEINNPINFVSANIMPLKRDLGDLMELLKIYSTMDEANAAQKLREISKLRENTDLHFTMEEIKSLISGIEEGSRRTAVIVKGLSNFSRLDEEKMMKANINDGIDSTLILLHNKLKHQNIAVIKSLGEIPEIPCYPGQLNQVFMNLIGNAIDAIGDEVSDGNSPGGERKIFVSTMIEDSSLKISIRDTGKGMNDAVKKRIFDPFYTTKEVGKGTGLGLSISYGIIEKHHGKIEVKSEEGLGTEFIIVLPVIQGNN